MIGQLDSNVHVVLSGMKIQNKSAAFGGGVLNYAAGDSLVINDCNISDNTASNRGGGIYNIGTLIGDTAQVYDNYAPPDPVDNISP